MKCPAVFDVALALARISMIAKRLCDVERWRRLAQDNIEDAGGDIIGLEEQLDAMAARVARLEAMLGVAIEHREVRG